MDTEKTPLTEDKEQPLTIEDVKRALYDNNITPSIIDTDGPVYISFKYDNYTFNLNLDNLPFLSFILEFELNSEEDIPLMKAAAEYVSTRSCGSCVFVVPEDLFWLVKYDYLSDSYSFFRDQLCYILDNMLNIAGYFYEYYINLVTNRRDSESTAFDKPITSD